jgi:GTPase SAR1 family protein
MVQLIKIEFIGASGVGKSTLFNEVAENKPDTAIWLTPLEARITLAKKKRVRQCKRGSHAILLAFLKLRIFKGKHAFLSYRVLRDDVRKQIYDTLDSYNDVIDIVLQAIATDQTIEPYRKAVFIEFYTNLIIQDVILLEKLSGNPIIVYDDGIIHNSFGLTDEIKFRELSNKNPSLIKRLLPQGAVFCELSLEDNLYRRKRRIAEGKGTILENQLTDEELIDICKESIQASEKVIDIFERHSIPVLKLNMNDSSKKNIQLFNQFIDNYN